MRLAVIGLQTLGFDLIGEQAEAHPLRKFSQELIKFKQNREREGVHVSFLSYSGETIRLGDETD